MIFLAIPIKGLAVALIGIGLAAFTLQWLMDESPPKAHAGLVPA